jgi:excisionase family DNA binding protein
MTNNNPFLELSSHLQRIEAQIQYLMGKDNTLTEYLSIEDAAKYLNLSKSAIYKRTMDKTIPFHRSGRKLLFKKSELINYIEMEANPQQYGIIVEK